MTRQKVARALWSHTFSTRNNRALPAVQGQKLKVGLKDSAAFSQSITIIIYRVQEIYQKGHNKEKLFYHPVSYLHNFKSTEYLNHHVGNHLQYRGTFYNSLSSRIDFLCRRDYQWRSILCLLYFGLGINENLQHFVDRDPYQYLTHFPLRFVFAFRYHTHLTCMY